MQSATKPSSRARVGRWVRRGAIVLGTLVAGALLALWILRDLPRREVERVLAQRLQARVRVGALSVTDTRTFVLHDLEIRRVAGVPWLEALRVERLVARGALRAVLDAHFDALELSGVRVRLAPPPAEPWPQPEGPPAAARVARLDAAGVLVVAGGTAEDTFEFRVALRDDGRGTTGDGTVRGAGLDLRGVARLAGLDLNDMTARLQEPQLAFAWEPGGVLTARLASRGVALHAAPAPPAAWGALAARARWSIDRSGTGRLAIDEARIDGLADAVAVELALPPAGGLHYAARARGVRAAALVPFVLLPGGLRTDARGTGDVTLEGDAARVRYAARLQLADVALAPAGGAAVVHAQDVTAALQGELALVAGDAPGRAAWHVSVPRLLALAGSPAPPGLAPCDVAFEGTFGLAPLVAAGRLDLRSAGLGTARVDGRADLAATPRTLDARGTWSGESAPLLALARTAAAGRVPQGLGVSGALAVHGSAAGPWDALRWTAHVAAPALDVALETRVRATGVQFEADAAGTGGILPVTVRRLTAAGRVAAPPLEARAFTLAASELGLSAAGATVRDLALSLPDLASATLAGTWDGAGAHAALHVEASDLARWRTLLEPLTGTVLPGYVLKGSAGARLDVQRAPDGAWTARGPVTLAKAGLSSDDGARAVEAESLALQLEARGRAAAPFLSQARVELPLGGFQLLWGELFLDYGALRAPLTVDLRPLPGARWSIGSTLDLPGAHVEGAAEAGAGPLSFELGIEAQDLGAAFRALVQAPLAGGVALVDRIALHGSAHATLRGALSPTLRRMQGELTAHGFGLQGTSGLFDLAGVDLELPFDFDVVEPAGGGPALVRGTPRAGALRWEKLVVHGLTVPALATPLEVRADSVALTRPLSVEVLGGRVLFERLGVTEFARRTRHAETGVEVDGLDLARLLRAFGLPPLEGRLTAVFPRAALTPRTLTVDGGGAVQVFGGTITFGEIAGQDMLGRYPKVSFSAELNGLDLGQLTRTFDVGEMTGIVDGSIRPLELFGGVPVRFDAVLRTAIVPGVSRTINVKAINNVAILGTGGRVTVFDRGLQRFFKRYTYDRIGIRMTLDGDEFQLRGLEHRGARELFMKGRLPLPIDIVNAQPGRTVSFRSMIDRLRALDYGGIKVGR